MASSNSSFESDKDNRLWEHGDDNSLTSNSSSSSDLDASCTSEAIPSPSSSQPLTPGLSSPMGTIGLSSQEPQRFFPESSSTPVRRWNRGRISRKSWNRGNQYTRKSSQLGESSSMDSSFVTPSKPKRSSIKLSRRGYTSRISEPFPQTMRVV